MPDVGLEPEESGVASVDPLAFAALGDEDCNSDGCCWGSCSPF